MGKPSKRRKSDGIQFNIGKRIKVQAQRKFAQGVAVLPQQASKDTSTSQNNEVKSQTKKMDFIMPSTPKVYTEDFLTFLCFKSSQSLPSHLRVTSFLQPQPVYSAPLDNSLSLEYNPQISQTLSTVQGFIPFGVRKQASQFPKKNISRKQPLQSVKSNFNKQKSSRFQTLTTKKGSSSVESRQKILTKANTKVAIAKTIAKKKNLVLTSNYTISTRRQSYQQKTLRKTFSSLSSSSHVSLRNRIISITSVKPDKIKLQESLKRKVEKSENIKQNKCSTPKSSSDKNNGKNSPSKQNKEDVIPDISANSESVSKSSIQKSSPAKTKTSKENEGSKNMCRTRSGTVRQLKTSTVTSKKIVTVKTKNNQVAKTPLHLKKTKVDGFEFSSDDDEPLYKKLANDSHSEEKDTPNKEPNEKGTGSHFTRSKIKDKTTPDKQSENSQNSKTLTKTVEKTIVSSRVTRQNIPKSSIENKVIAKQTRSKGLISNVVLKSSMNKIKKNNLIHPKVLSKKSYVPIKKNTDNQKNSSEQQSPQQSSEKTLLLNNINGAAVNSIPKNEEKSDLIPKVPVILQSPKPSEVKLEKSFSESDDEPLAAKLIENSKNVVSDIKKCSQNEKDKSPVVLITTNLKAAAINEKLNLLSDSVNDKGKSINVPTSNVNPIPSYEESLKVYGIAHRYTDEKLSMTQLVKIKNCNQKFSKEKESPVTDKKQEFRSLHENTAIQNKNDLKNRPSRKFMKPKEYIEQWLKNSARPFTNHSTINISEFSNDSTHSDKNLKLIDSFDITKKLNNEPNNSIQFPTAFNKTTGMNNKYNDNLSTLNSSKVDENNAIFTPAKNSTLESGNDDLNIYDFESEPELVASPPRKSKLIKEPIKRTEKLRSKYNTSDKMSSVTKVNEKSQNDDFYADKVVNPFGGMFINKSDSENKLSSTESIGNVISNAIIASLEPTEDIPNKESLILISGTGQEKKLQDSENGSDALIYKYTKESVETSQKMYTNNSVNQYLQTETSLQYPNSISRNPDYLGKMNFFPNKNTEFHHLDSLKTKKEFVSITNTLKNMNKSVHDGIESNTVKPNTTKQSTNITGSLDFSNNLFILQSKKDFMYNINVKDSPAENSAKNIQSVQYQEHKNVNNLHKFSLENYKNSNIANNTSNMYHEPSNIKFFLAKERDVNNTIENDLTQSSSYYSPRSTISNSSELEKLPMYIAPHSTPTQLIIPKYDRLNNMHNTINKLNVNLKNVNLPGRSENQVSSTEKLNSNYEFNQRKYLNKNNMNESYQFFEKNVMNTYNILDKKSIPNEHMNQNSKPDINNMKNDQVAMNAQENPELGQKSNDNMLNLKKIQQNFAMTISPNHVPVDNLFNKTLVLNPESKGMFSQSIETLKQNTSIFNRNASMSMGTAKQPGITEISDSLFSKSINVENKNKFTPLSQIKNISIGDARMEGISSITLKNFRLSSAMSNTNKSLSNMSKPSSSSLSTSDNPQLSVTDKSNEANSNKAQQNTNLEAKTANSQKSNESEDHLFYIPLQGMSKTGVDISNHLIEGVAVKMDTQGPDGPQQRVIMRAKLVRKSQINKNVNKTTGKKTGPILDMVRSVREAFPEATIHSDNLPDDAQPKGKKNPKLNTSTMSKRATNYKDRNQKNTSAKTTACSSNFSQSTSKRASSKSGSGNESINHTNSTSFPQMEDPAQVVEAPVFQPTEKEFQDPLDYIEKISPIAARYGLCRIIPPSSFKSECKISDDMRFTPHNQFLHRMLYRWGPSSREMCAIKKYLATQSVTFKQPPTLSGIEVDLPKLYHIVQNMGGLNKVLEKKMWHKVAEEMCLPVNMHYMDIRLDEIYCKYLLPYDTLSPDERRRLFESVDIEWEKRQKRMIARATNPLNLLNSMETDELDYDITEDVEECITRGKSTTLCSFARTAKNNMTMQFGKVQQPTPDEVESKFWNYVTMRDSHVCVSTGSIDSSVWGYGFPSIKCKNSPISKHPWNLKVLTNNSGSVLRSLGPIMGVTVPTIHVGMLFSTCCWYRDPHGLPWIEYLHDGAPKIWYGVPDSQSVKFKETLMSIVPGYCQKKTVWLLSDTTMVPPTILKEHGVSLCRTVQNPGEFILVFPKAFTSSICAGYNVSESVYFAPNSWLDTAQQDFIDIRNSCEPSMFSLERLIVAVAEDIRTPYQILKQVLPALNKIIQTEKQQREALFNIGLKASERSQNVFISKKKVAKRQDEVEECHRCRTSLSLSMLYNDTDSSVFCLMHAAEHLSVNPSQIDKCKLVYMHSIDELERLLSKHIERINVLANKKCSKTK